MKVLAVENNPKLLKLLTHLLEKEGFETVTAEGGVEALEQFRKHSPDIICLDVLMEDMSGIEVCREIRKSDADAVILMVTSKSRDVDVAEGMAAGANDYIIKPFDLSDITARMRAIAKELISKKPADPANASFQMGDISVYPDQLRAERAGEGIDLNFRDIAMLRLLGQNKGRTLSAAELEPYCWAAQSLTPDKAVHWYMEQLRKKVEINPASPLVIKGNDGGYIHE